MARSSSPIGGGVAAKRSHRPDRENGQPRRKFSTYVQKIRQDGSTSVASFHSWAGLGPVLVGGRFMGKSRIPSAGLNIEKNRQPSPRLTRRNPVGPADPDVANAR